LFEFGIRLVYSTNTLGDASCVVTPCTFVVPDHFLNINVSPRVHSMMLLILLAYKIRDSKCALWDYTALQKGEKGEIVTELQGIK
jgi:hypothetical protein